MEIKGYKLKKSTKNFRAFEETSIFNGMEDFLNLCEIQLKEGYKFICRRYDYLIFVNYKKA